MKHKNDISLLILLSFFLMQALVNQIVWKAGPAEYFVLRFSAV